MWKYVSRRIKDTFERSINHLDKRSTTGVVNGHGNLADEKNKRTSPQSYWFCSRKCWSSYDSDNDTNSKRWNFDHLNRTWIGAITWSSALVISWYTSQLIHLKLKYKSRNDETKCPSINNLVLLLHPYLTSVNKNAVSANSASKIEKIVDTFIPTVHLMSNEQDAVKNETPSTSDTSSDVSDNDLGEVLNSIENKLGLAAIENGQHQDGLNLLRSAANRNHAPALYNLGLCYEMGLGVTADENAAMDLYKSAAALQHPGALYNLGIYYGQGRGGVQRDIVTATRLLRLAAVQGQQNAIAALKSLEGDCKEPTYNDTNTWSHPCTSIPQTDSFVPTPTRLFVENVNYQNNVTIY